MAPPRTLNGLIRESLQFIKKNIPDGAMVGFSGGKDSIATAWLMRKAKKQHDLVYTYTTIDPPEIVNFIKENYPECKIIRPKRTFWAMIGSQNPPTFFVRWCCHELKKRPSWKLPHYHRVFGMRAEESKARAEYPMVNKFERNSKRGMLEHIQYYPILKWPEWAVWELIEREGLAYPDLYNEFGRIGCMVCPMRRGPEHSKWREKFPKAYKTWEHAVARWYDKRKESGRDMNNDTVEGFLEDWYKGKAKWYKGKKR